MPRGATSGAYNSKSRFDKSLKIHIIMGARSKRFFVWLQKPAAHKPVAPSRQQAKRGRWAFVLGEEYDNGSTNSL